MSLTKVYNRMISGSITNVVDFGAVDGGADSTSAIQAAINAGENILIPSGTFYTDQLTIPSNKKIIISGTLTFKSGQSNDAVMLVNSDAVSGNTNIVITGDGELDGNASNQTNDRQGLIKLTNVTDCEVSVYKIGNNKYSNTEPTAAGVGCVVIEDATSCVIKDILLKNWQREGLYFNGTVVNCSIQNIIAYGDGLHSWTAASISGASAQHNSIDNITVYNCGASSVNLDSEYSSVSNITSYDNTYGNGVNFGHTGKPASYSSGSNITIYNAGRSATSGTSHNGISIGGSSIGITLSNCNVDTAYNHCLNISDSAASAVVSNCNFRNATNGSGVNVFGGDNSCFTNVTCSSNSDNGIELGASDDCIVTGCKLDGNTNVGLDYSGTDVIVRGTKVSTDSMSGSQAITGATAGDTFTITNANIRGYETGISLFARTTDAANGNPYIVSQSQGSMVIAVAANVSASGGPHNVSYIVI